MAADLRMDAEDVLRVVRGASGGGPGECCRILFVANTCFCLLRVATLIQLHV
jgi:hypothetical protein